MSDINWDDSGWDSQATNELGNYMANTYGEEIQPWQGGNRDMETGEFYNGLNEANSGTNFESMAGWKYENGKWTDPSGKTYNLNSPNLSAALKASGLAKYAGAAGLGALVGSLLNSGGGKGSNVKIPQFTASRTQYALPQSLAPQAQRDAITDEKLRGYLNQQGLADNVVAQTMQRYGISPERVAGVAGLDLPTVQNKYQTALGPNVGLENRRPGSGGITYFSPMQYSPVGSFTTDATGAPAVPPPVEPVQAAGGGMMSSGGISNLGGYSDGGRLLRGPGDGVSDSIPASINNKQPARLADGEFVIPARIVSELGNGSTEAGARKLYAMMDRIQKSRRKAKNIAADTKADKQLPA